MMLSFKLKNVLSDKLETITAIFTGVFWIVGKEPSAHINRQRVKKGEDTPVI